MPIPCEKLSNGVLYPAIMLGTASFPTDESTAFELINTAFSLGYPGVDTAWYYRNEHIIAKPIREFTAKRNNLKLVGCDHFLQVSQEEFQKNFLVPHGPVSENHNSFVTTKIWYTDFTALDIRLRVKEHMEKFRRARADLVLLHWPGIGNWFPEYNKMGEEGTAWLNCNERRFNCWLELEKLYAEGKVRAIGVSNYMLQHLAPLVEDILQRKKAGDKFATIPMINQVEISVFCDLDPELLAFCREHDIRITSYATMTRQEKMNDEKSTKILKSIGNKYNQSIQNVMLRWALQKAYTIIPKTSKIERLEENLGCLEFELTPEDMNKLSSLNEGFRTCGDPHTIS